MKRIYRKPATLAAVHVDDGEESVVLVYVACDDGTVWMLEADSSPYWEELEPIPGSRGEVEAAGAADDA